VVKTLLETVLIVMVVIFLFLGSLRSVLVPVVAIPVSLIGAVFLMQVFGFTLNLLTLLAIVLAVGLVVDDAIVVVENVERHIREGKTPLDASMLGARELVGPIIAMTITLGAVYAPIGFQGGPDGLAVSRVRVYAGGRGHHLGRGRADAVARHVGGAAARRSSRPGLSGRIDRGFERLKRAYGRALDFTLASRPAVYTSWVVLSLLAGVLFTMSARELAPTEDQGVIFGIVSTPSNATLDQTVRFTEAVNEAFFQSPETKYSFQVTSPTFGFGGAGMKPWNERERTVFEILPEMQQRLQAIPGIQTFPVLPPALPGGGQFPVEFILASTASTEEILGFAQQLQQKAATSGLFAFPPLIDVKIDQPQSEVVFDRDKVATLGLDLRSVGQDLSAAMGGNYVNRFNLAGRSYKVIPQVGRTDRLNPDQLSEIYVTGPGGQLIALSSIATIRDKVGPRSLNRFQQLNAVKISGVAIRPLDEALKYLESEAAQILPKGYSLDYTGESRQLRTEGDKFLPAFGLAVVLIFLVLAAQFNSFRDPFVILMGSVPLAMFGALTLTFLKMPNPNMTFWTDGWTTTLNVYSRSAWSRWWAWWPRTASSSWSSPTSCSARA
jgi:multidrug efflux pump